MSFRLAELWPWWLGGIAIGLLVPFLYYFFNTALGVSTGYGNLLKIIDPSTKLKWLQTDTYRDSFNWRFLFLTGMVLGGFLSARVAGMPALTPDMGLFTQRLSWPYVVYFLWFFAGGVLLGLGARLAKGCTSGHSIHGLATFQKSSLVATACFLLSGTAVTGLIRLLVFGGR